MSKFREGAIQEVWTKPSLDPQQRKLIDEVFGYWKENHAWPNRGRLLARLKRVGLNLEAVLESLPPRLVDAQSHSGDRDSVRLTIRGLSLCPGSDVLIKAFIDLHRIAAERFVEDPTAEVRISKDDALELLGNFPPDELEAASEAIRMDFTSSSERRPQSGGWVKVPGEHVILFERVDSIEAWVGVTDYRIEEVGTIGPRHVSLLKAAYSHWRTEREWPEIRRFIVQHRADEAYRLLHEMPRDYFWSHHVKGPGSTSTAVLRLSFRGVVASSVADSDLEVLVKALGALCGHFLSDNGDQAITSARIEKQIGATAPEMLRVGYFLQTQHFGVSIDLQEHSWTARVSSYVLSFEHVGSVDGLMEKCHLGKSSTWRTDVLQVPENWEYGWLNGVDATESEPEVEDSVPTKQDVWKKWQSGWDRRENPLGSGGGGDVYLVRRPRVPEQTEQRIRDAFWAAFQGTTTKFSGTLNLQDRDRLCEALLEYVRTHTEPEYAALKVIRLPEEKQRRTTALERMRAELEIMRTFSDHPNCLRLIESGPGEGMFITEYQERGSLEDKPNLFSYKGNLGKALEDLRGIVDLLARVHGRKRVHRDVAPKNIFVSKEGTLILGDWGIVWEEDRDGAALSASGDVLGTKDMMPLWSRHHGIDQKPPSMDVYSFSKTLWMMVAGTKNPLPREEWADPRYDLERRFPDKPEMYYLRELFEKTLVAQEEDCLKSGEELGQLVEAILDRIKRARHPLRRDTKRPCTVCADGEYEFLTSGDDRQSGASGDRDGGILQELGLQPAAGSSRYKHVARCSACGHVQLFVWPRESTPEVWKGSGSRGMK